MRRWYVLCAALLIAGACGATAPLIDDVASYLEVGDNAAAAGHLVDARVCLHAGTGPMGTDDGDRDEGPAHVVDLGAFCVDRYEVTNVQYAVFVDAAAAGTPDYWPGGEPPLDALLQPVVGVSWDDADAYCRWVGGRLPTEAEWERTCRGTDGRRWPWGDEWSADRIQVSAAAVEHPDDAWPGALGEPLPGGAVLLPIGSSDAGATPDGVYGLADGVMEWVADWYDADAYSRLSASNPLATGPPRNHVVRGAAWLFPYDRPDDVADLARCSARNASHVVASARIGFRCAFDR